ncbi:MAG: hypothetical protein J0I12_02265 [Candidatus Eremiobacteraeota bacterium]|nr:hypothetical protein [Candidatus Eremiobacteraeota bacterium]
MEKMQSYAFENGNAVGEARPPVRTPLLQKDGHLWLCAPDTFVPGGSALVERSDAKSPWRPLESLEALGAFLSAGKDIAQLLGVWTDKAKWGLFGVPDGKIQEKEVETFAARWQGLRLDEQVQFEDKGYRSADPHQPPQRCVLGWWHLEGEVDAAGLRLLEAAYPDKLVAVLEEPRRIVRHSLGWGLRFEHDKGRTALVPTVLSQHVHDLNGRTEGGRLKADECLARGQKEANPSYVLPEA